MNHLTASEKSAVESALREEHARALRQLHQDQDQRGQTQYSEILGRASGDSSDEALAVTLGDLSAARLEHEVRHVRELEAALARVKDEDFGFCQDCGAAIPLQRLVANPSATRCIGCQGQFEKTHAHHGHGSL